jgi:PAS domain S-box-containing protein
MSQPLRVLLVEDNPNDAELVLRTLRQAGFDPEWHRVETEQEFQERLTPDLDIILSDYDMPTFNGPHALKLLKQSGMDIPFIIISGTIGEEVAVEVMKLGATDYLLKDRLARLGISIKQTLEQKRLQSERQQVEISLNLFRKLVDHSSDGFEVIEPATGRFLDVNETSCLRLGYKREELLSMGVPDIEATALDLTTWSRNVEEVRRLGFKSIEGWHRRKDGSTFPVEINVRYVQLDRDYMIAVVRDNTERKRSNDQLREQASMLDKARDAIMVRDLEHGITYWNKSAELLYGWTAEEVKGRQTADLLYPDLPAYETAIAAVLSKGEWSGEIQQITKSGAAILIEARWTLVCDDAGRPQSVFAINNDITEKKKMEQQFLRAQRMESIGTLAGGIAHDLNNVLAPILMSIDLLRLTSRDERSKSVLSTIETSAKRGAGMVKQILSFARGVEGERTTINVRHIIEEMQHLVQDTFPKDIIFRAELEADLPLFSGDHTQVHQVLLNLCVNARDAMPNGGTLSVSAASLQVDDNYASMTPGSKPGRHLMIKVTDTGSGIPPEVVDKIFDPFFTTKELGKGTGLGLSTVLAIVKSHGGFLNVYSEPGNGTTFSVCFPAMDAVEGAAEQVEEDTHPRGNGELILIVDDEAAVRTITQQTLETYGYRVLTAADGTEAVALYSMHRTEIAVVVTDMMMPVMGGQATVQVLQRLNSFVKIIAASGLANDGSAARSAAMGVKHFLPKPFTAQTILTALKQVLNEGF